MLNMNKEEIKQEQNKGLIACILGEPNIGK